MNNTLSYKMVVSLLKDLSLRHNLIKSFGFGQTSDIPENADYAMLWVEPATSNVSFSDSNKRYTNMSYSFNLYLFDRVSKSDENYLDTLSSTMFILNTIITEISNHKMYRTYNMSMSEDISIEPVIHNDYDDLNGCSATLTFNIPVRYTNCNIPIEPISSWTASFNYSNTEYYGRGATGPAGPAGPTGPGFDAIINPADNRILTSNGTTDEAIAESGLTYDGNILGLDGSLLFNRVDTTPAVGKLTWDGVGLSVGMTGGNVNLQIGQEELVRVHNVELTTLNDGEIVYLFGSTGDKPSVKRASNLDEVRSTKVLGMVTEPIAHGGDGFISTHGLVNGIDLRAFNEGDVLWLGATAGSITNVKPTAPNHLVFIGIVVRANANGIAYVNPQNGYELNELHDVEYYDKDTLADRSILVWNSTTKLWENEVFSGSIGLTERDGSPTFSATNIIFPNGSLAATASGVLVNRFNGRRTITRSGFTGILPNTDDINEFLEAVFYPAVPPSLSLSANNTSREFGATTSTTLTWSVTKQTRGISSITVNGGSITVPTSIDEDSDPFPTTVNGTVAANATQNVNTTFNMSISDSASNVFNTSVAVSWFNKRYWGRSSNIVPNDATIIAAAGGGSEFSTTRSQTRNGFNGSGQYLFFAWPSTFGTPTFTVNGLPNTAWTKQRSADNFVNASGYTTTYDVWVSNTVQNSPLNIVVS